MTKRDWNGEFFKPEDFKFDTEAVCVAAAMDANYVLRYEIEKLEMVYRLAESGDKHWLTMPRRRDWGDVTHQTKILPPKEIEK